MQQRFTKKNKKELEPLILEYFIIFQKSGLPIFSKCFGDFCQVLLVDDIILSGFLSALTTMPAMFGKDRNKLNAVEIGYTKLLFNHTTPSGHTICLGFKFEEEVVKKDERIDELFKKIEFFIEETHKNVNWPITPKTQILKIENELIDTIITPWVKIDEHYKTHGPNCTMSVESDLYRGENDSGMKEPIWKRLKEAFANRRQMLKDQLSEKRTKLIERGLLKKE